MATPIAGTASVKHARGGKRQGAGPKRRYLRFAVPAEMWHELAAIRATYMAITPASDWTVDDIAYDLMRAAILSEFRLCDRATDVRYMSKNPPHPSAIGGR